MIRNVPELSSPMAITLTIQWTEARELQADGYISATAHAILDSHSPNMNTPIGTAQPPKSPGINLFSGGPRPNFLILALQSSSNTHSTQNT
jgi:hypothetical protein